MVNHTVKGIMFTHCTCTTPTQTSLSLPPPSSLPLSLPPLLSSPPLPSPPSPPLPSSLSPSPNSYVKGLKLIDQDFRSTILSANRAHEKPVLSEETLKLILGNVSSILTLNSDMLKDLEDRMKIWLV